jgi:hypothetical protein
LPLTIRTTCIYGVIQKKRVVTTIKKAIKINELNTIKRIVLDRNLTAMIPKNPTVHPFQNGM